PLIKHMTRPTTYFQSLRSAMDIMLEQDENIVTFGEAVGYFGGVFRCTEGLQTKYGSSQKMTMFSSRSSMMSMAERRAWIIVMGRVLVFSCAMLTPPVPGAAGAGGPACPCRRPRTWSPRC